MVTHFYLQTPDERLPTVPDHRGQAWLAEKLTKRASRPIVYQREDVTAELTATIGVSRYEQNDGEGIVKFIDDFQSNHTAI